MKFSERLEEKGPAVHVRIEPAPEEPVAIDVSGAEISFLLPNLLDGGRLWMVTIGRGVKDEHGNRLDREYQLAYAAGDAVPMGEISGRVHNPHASSSLVYLYDAQVPPDTLWTRKPLYYEETDDSGRYRFSHLSTGRYDLAAFSGGRAPAEWSPARMPYGLPWSSPVVLTSDSSRLVGVDIAVRRELAPMKVDRAEMIAPSVGRVEFSNPVDSASVPKGEASAIRQDGAAISIYLLYSPARPAALRFVTSEPVAGPALLRLSTVADTSGQAMRAFEGTLVPGLADTLAPALEWPRDGEAIRIAAPREPALLYFSAPLSLPIPKESVVVSDGGGNPFPVTVAPRGSAALEVRPAERWGATSGYTISIQLDELSFLNARAPRDFELAVNVRTGSFAGSGAISGRVKTAWERATIRATQGEGTVHLARVNSDGTFLLNDLAEGDWMLTVFQDRDGDGRYTFGRAAPHRAAEPFYHHPEAISVRARWTVEEVILEPQWE